tara:strand:+ start:446 stop:985 length:540 start_codon:yes stop_codon:yes gene_type:complete
MRKLIITAGHNGAGTGASSLFIDEGKETIVLRDLLTIYLRNYGVTVKNDTDTESTSKVISWVNQLFTPNDILIEIHFNSFSSWKPSGTESFVQSKHNSTEYQLAQSLCSVTSKVLNINNRGVKSPALSQHSTIGILDKTKVNAVLYEVCFLSNKNDAERYQEKKKELVHELSQAILLFL